MASPVDICNVALAHIGHKATIIAIDPPEQSVEAEYGALFWPTVRKSVLTSFRWSHSTERVAPAALSITPPTPWLYAYPFPSAAIRFWGVKEPAATDDIPFSDCKVARQSSATVIYTNVENASLVYTVDNTDTTTYGPMLVSALECLMAARFAGPIIKGAEGMRTGDYWEKRGTETLMEAKRIDAAQSLNHDVTSPSTYRAGQLQARGLSTVTADAEITRS